MRLKSLRSQHVAIWCRIAAGIGAVSAGVLAGCATAARAATIDDLTVRKVGDRYLVELHAQLDARSSAAYAVFADLANLPAINTDVRHIEIESRAGANPVELGTVIRACVLFYCRSIRESQRMTFVRRPDGGDVYASVLPGGDLRSGRARWLFRDSGGRTDLRVTAELQPAFLIPPLIGPWVVKRWLRAETIQSSANIEKLAAASVRSTRERTRYRPDP